MKEWMDGWMDGRKERMDEWIRLSKVFLEAGARQQAHYPKLL